MVKACIDALCVTFSAQQINTPLNIHMSSIFYVTENCFAHNTLTFCTVFIVCLIMLFVVFILFGFVTLIVVMIHGSFVRSIQPVPFLPVHIRHPHLLPLINIFEILTFMPCIFQQVSIAKCVVRRRNWGFKRPGHPVLILLYLSIEPSRLAFF